MITLEGFEGFREIGSGGFSTVYSAHQAALDRDVAVKVLEVRGVDVSRIQREIIALGRLSDIPNVITAYELASLEDGRPALVMALMSTSLGELVRQGVQHGSDLVVRWLPQVAAALDEAHRRGVFHRDLKPDNILISTGGDAYLADFGISGVDSLAPSTTTAYSLTPHHASPERFANEVEDPVADDIYSLGSTVYASMAGRPPFGTAAEGGVHGLVTRVMHDPVPPIEGLPARAQKVFQRVLAKNPAQRYGSAVAFAAALQDAMREEFQLGPGTDVAAVEESELTRRRIRTEEVVEEPTKLSQLARPGPDQTEPAGEGHRGAARRRRVVVAGVGLLALFGVGGALLTVTGDDAGGGSDGGAQADDAWRSEFISLREEASSEVGAPEGLADCMADGLVEEVDDPAAFVAEWTDALERQSEWDPESNTASPVDEGDHDRSATLDRLERSCVGEVIAIGTEPTVTGEAVQVDLTRDSACALLDDGSSACWGSNWDELAFDGSGFGPDQLEYPVAVDAPKARKLVSAPFSYRCVITLDDDVSCLDRRIEEFVAETDPMAMGPLIGTNTYLVAGKGAGKYRVAEEFGKVADFAMGDEHRCAVRVDGSVWCAGSNEFGQLGDGTRENRLQPVRVEGLGPASSIVAGEDHTCAALPDGAVWCWGISGVDLGWDTSPVRIEGLPAVKQMAAGEGFTCGVTSDLELWCWGALVDVLGDRSLSGTKGPVRIDSDVDVRQVDAFEKEICFASATGEMYCFGDGRPLPRPVENVSRIEQVSISEQLKCGVDSAGEVDCFGETAGPLDDEGRPTPSDGIVAVPGFGPVG